MNPSTLLLLLVLLPLLSALITYTAGKLLRHRERVARITRCILLPVFCALEFIIALLLLPHVGSASLSLEFARLNLSFDGLRAIYALVTVFMWLGSSLLVPQYFRRHGISDRFCLFFLIILGTTLGVFLSTDLLTTFFFFEMTSLASYAWIAEEETVGSLKAGKAYLTLAVISGTVALFGLILLYHCAGTLDFTELRTVCPSVESRTELYAAAVCILLGFGAKAGLFPAPSWLPRIHPIAPTPASALLSGVITKTGIFGILIVTANVLPGEHAWGKLLLVLGAITMLGGALLALFSVHLKRTLACSSISQIGFITVGIAMICLSEDHNALAANGTILYMLNHSISKLVLFLTAGAIYAMAHTLDLNEMRGFGRRRPLLGTVFLVGGASLAGIPGTLGYLAKTLIHESLVEYAARGDIIVTAVEWIFLLSGGLTAAYVTKLFIAIFVERPSTVESNSEHKKARLTLLSYIALLMGVFPILLSGCMPHRLAERVCALGLPFVGGEALSHPVAYFSWTNLRGICISLLIAAVIYGFAVRGLLMKSDESGARRIYVNRLPARLALDTLLYVPIGKLLLGLLTAVARIVAALPEKLVILPVRLTRLALRSLRDLLGRAKKKRRANRSKHKK